MKKHIAGLEKTQLEKSWAEHEATNKLTPTEFALWKRMGHLFKPVAYHHKIFIAWTMQGDTPQVKEVFTVQSVDCSFQAGMWITVYAKVANTHFTLDYTPRLLPGVDIFGWLPHFNEARYVSRDWSDMSQPMALRMNLCLRMMVTPERLQENRDYIQEVHVFREMFPQYSETKF
jgi:hypothetical protein